MTTNSSIHNKITTFYIWLKEYWPCILISLTVIGFVSKSLYNYPISVMAVIGLYRTVTSPKVIWQDETLKSFFIIFLCLWIPLFLSFPDAANQKHSAHTVFPYLRFLFAGIFIIQELSYNKKRIKFVIISIFLIVTFWCIDASLQLVLGQDIFGYPYDKYLGLTGMFYPRNTIAHICSILSVFYFITVHRIALEQKWSLLLLVPLFLVILVSGRRAAWIMLALSSMGFLVYLYLSANNKKQILILIGSISLVLSIILGSTALFHKPTNNRLKATQGLFSFDYDAIDHAMGMRLQLWETAYSTFKANPINGIGPRGFRHTYQQYASPDNYWVNQTHPHLLTLEIMAETGIIGLLGYMLALYLLIHRLLIRKKILDELPFFLPVLVALFPLNAHMAFYGSIWSSMIWLLLSLYFAKVKLND
ncbi:MAG: O-antigen ligase family protein [Proteobacteria bacterium]|nr:O-antigen ligase family protein [Pseudomonadota bacterium]